jgi:transposase InsO family protein
LELLRGADLDSVSRRHGVTAATLSSWRDEFLASGEAGLKSRETHVDEEETQRLKRVVARILRVWELPRSTFYAQRARRAQPATGRRGRTPTLDDAALLAQIRTVIAESPFHGEGHRKIWARLRTLKQVRTSMRRVLRVMREAALLAPARPPEPVVERPHDGTIVPERPNVMWGTDATAAVTIVEGPATIVAAIDPCTAECVGIHATRHGDRFDALEPLRQGVRAHFGGLAPAIAHGLALRHDHGSVYLSGDFQTEITFLGMTSSPAFVRQPEGDGCIERCFRTLNEQLLWVRHFNTIEELRQALLAFKETYNREWLIARLGYRSPTQTRQAFAVRPAA